jgi:Raf kinase inhibitor-like YbhB/YbcL family protein
MHRALPTLRLAWIFAGLGALAGAVAAQVDDDAGGEPPSEEGDAMKLESTAFEQNGQIPEKYTCEGGDVPPPLSWSGIPDEARSLVLIVDDPDAPDPAAPRMTFTHWLLFNVPKVAPGLPEGADPLPDGAAQGLNDWNREGYGGPCPPIGRHRYFFKLYALDTTLELEQPKKAELEAAIDGHVLAQAELIGTYEKHAKRAR